MNCRREKAGLPVDDEQEYLPLSWLSQADYCLRRAALLLNERVWVENVETAKGRAEHERVHTQRVERRGDFVKLYENSVFSDKMQISGKCDCIEAVRDENGCTIPAVDFPVRLLPVEYKHGKIRDVRIQDSALRGGDVLRGNVSHDDPGRCAVLHYRASQSGCGT